MEAVFLKRGQNLSYFGLPEAVGRRLDIMTALRTLQPATTHTERPLRWAIRHLGCQWVKVNVKMSQVQAIMEHEGAKSSRQIASLIL